MEKHRKLTHQEAPQEKDDHPWRGHDHEDKDEHSGHSKKEIDKQLIGGIAEITNRTSRSMATQILNFRDIAKGDRDGSILTITSLDGVVNGLVEMKDRVLMGRDSEQTCTQTVAGMLSQTVKEKKKKQTRRSQMTRAMTLL